MYTKEIEKKLKELVIPADFKFVPKLCLEKINIVSNCSTSRAIARMKILNFKKKYLALEEYFDNLGLVGECKDVLWIDSEEFDMFIEVYDMVLKKHECMEDFDKYCFECKEYLLCKVPKIVREFEMALEELDVIFVLGDNGYYKKIAV